ncbi:MAG TPA: TraR/DksA C4-type zinc finger protein [Planctomycetota bacterium]|nr:TraR/DksA C4-type zinc finger protein [Planctomycetota bacterium]
MTNDNASKAQAFTADELSTLREALFARRRAITESQAHRLNELNDSEARTHLADIEEVSETSQSDHLYEIIGTQDATLHQIDIALEKIEAGSYGYCEECSQPIPRARLEALPFASYCVPCQRQQELEAQLSAEQE